MTAAILWPVRNADLAREDTADSYAVRVEIGGVVETLTTAALAPADDWWLAGDDQPRDLVAELERTIEQHTGLVAGTFGGQTLYHAFNITIDRLNRLRFWSAIPFRLLWGDPLTTLAAAPFGLDQTNTPEGQEVLAPRQTRGAFTPQRLPEFDSHDRRRILTAKAKPAISGLMRTARLSDPLAVRDMFFSKLFPRHALEEFADPTEPTGTAEHVWREAGSYGRMIRYYPDDAIRTATSFGNYLFRTEDIGEEGLDKLVKRGDYQLWRFDLPLRRAA